MCFERGGVHFEHMRCVQIQRETQISCFFIINDAGTPSTFEFCFFFLNGCHIFCQNVLYKLTKFHFRIFYQLQKLVPKIVSLFCPPPCKHSQRQTDADTGKQLCRNAGDKAHSHCICFNFVVYEYKGIGIISRVRQSNVSKSTHPKDESSENPCRPSGVEVLMCYSSVSKYVGIIPPSTVVFPYHDLLGTSRALADPIP